MMFDSKCLTHIEEACVTATPELQQLTRAELNRIRAFLAQYQAANRVHFSERRAILAAVLYCLEKIDRAAVQAQHIQLCSRVKNAHDAFRRFVPGARELGAVAA